MTVSVLKIKLAEDADPPREDAKTPTARAWPQVGLRFKC